MSSSPSGRYLTIAIRCARRLVAPTATSLSSGWIATAEAYDDARRPNDVVATPLPEKESSRAPPVVYRSTTNLDPSREDAATTILPSGWTAAPWPSSSPLRSVATKPPEPKVGSGSPGAAQAAVVADTSSAPPVSAERTIRRMLPS